MPINFKITLITSQYCPNKMVLLGLIIIMS